MAEITVKVETSDRMEIDCRPAPGGGVEFIIAFHREGAFLSKGMAFCVPEADAAQIRDQLTAILAPGAPAIAADGNDVPNSGAGEGDSDA